MVVGHRDGVKIVHPSHQSNNPREQRPWFVDIFPLFKGKWFWGDMFVCVLRMQQTCLVAQQEFFYLAPAIDDDKMLVFHCCMICVYIAILLQWHS
jgi:hypothetical protein